MKALSDGIGPAGLCIRYRRGSFILGSLTLRIAVDGALEGCPSYPSEMKGVTQLRGPCRQTHKDTHK